MLTKLRNILYCHVVTERGVAAIEFALVFAPFMMSVLFIIEICRMVFVSSAVDMIIAESGNIAAVTTTPDKYYKYFNDEMNKRMQDWPLISNDVIVKVSLASCKDIDAVIDNKCSTSGTPGSSDGLAFYSMQADYKPLFYFFPTSSAEKILSRRILLVQEHQLDREKS